VRAKRPSASSPSMSTSRATARKWSRSDQATDHGPARSMSARFGPHSTDAMPSDGTPNPEDDLLQRPPIGLVRCSLCGRRILKIKELAKAALRSKVGILHQRCYDALNTGRGERQAPRRGTRKRTAIRADGRRGQLCKRRSGLRSRVNLTMPALHSQRLLHPLCPQMPPPCAGFQDQENGKRQMCCLALARCGRRIGHAANQYRS